MGIRRAHDAMQCAGAQAISIDITNAFNSIPREEILNGLDVAQVPRTMRNYIASFLQLRHGLHMHEVPQGDPLSMLLYCLGQGAFLEKVRESFPSLIAYADDILIIHDDSQNAQQIVDRAATLAREHGLTINLDKCKSTQLGHQVTFLGAPVSREKLSIATEVVDRSLAQLARVMGADICHHAKLTLVRICVVPMVTFAPLVEMESSRASYDTFDRAVGRAMANLLGSDPQKWVDFLAAPKENGGLGVHLPGAYHALLRRAFHSLDVATGRRAPVGERTDLVFPKVGYANRVLGALRILPDDAFRRLTVSCGLAPAVPLARPLSTMCTLCGARMSEDHMVNCKQTQLYRVLRHDAIVCWLFNHLATRRKTTVIYEQKVWVDTEGRNQQPDLFLPDNNMAIDVGVEQLLRAEDQGLV